ncbi:hypothetical protein F511_11354 [Dorcoceras hygrometricum]|uniref:Uncharacterized protein n=1 Tax=Dorcoceras hygrometricum TaxID=472368 RepID=A0A2Z7CGJ4_9LAMI|nr:hypothetical protein F511_11354 [Dorcoceras hygrometricum]
MQLQSNQQQQIHRACPGNDSIKHLCITGNSTPRAPPADSSLGPADLPEKPTITNTRPKQPQGKNNEVKPRYEEQSSYNYQIKHETYHVVSCMRAVKKYQESRHNDLLRLSNLTLHTAQHAHTQLLHPIAHALQNMLQADYGYSDTRSAHSTSLYSAQAKQLSLLIQSALICSAFMEHPGPLGSLVLNGVGDPAVDFVPTGGEDL